MPTVRLVPSTIYNYAGTNYIEVTNADNAYTNTDSTTYATLYNKTASTSNRYVYLRGFNFDDIPSNAVVSSFSIKFKANESGLTTSSSYRPYLANGTSTITGTCSAITTSVSTKTFTGVTATWATISGYGSNFGIRFNVRRNSRNTAGYLYLYGAEIEVTYTVPNPRTITSTLTGNGTINPSGANTYYDGDTYTLTITPAISQATITATKDGVSITSSLVNHTTYYTYSYTVSGNATIAVTIVDPVPRTITSTLTGNGTINPSGAQTYYDGATYTLTITPTDSLATVTATKDGTSISLVNHTTYYTYSYTVSGNATIAVTIVDPVYYTVTASSAIPGIEVSPASQTILSGGSATVTFEVNDITDYKVKDNGTDVTSQLVRHQHSGGGTLNTNLGTYALTSGGFSGSGATYFQGLVGKGESASTTTSNYYSSGSSTIAVFTYNMYFTNIPDGATITRVYCKVSGHPESTSQSSEYMCAQLISGSTNLSSEYNFKSSGTTSNTVQTLECTTLPTISQLASMQLKCRLGYYGGALNGATAYVEYSMPAGYYYTYTLNNLSDSHIVILDVAGPDYILYVKMNGTWTEISKAYRKVSGIWTEIEDLSTVFDPTKNYVRGD